MLPSLGKEEKLYENIGKSYVEKRKIESSLKVAETFSVKYKLHMLKTQKYSVRWENIQKRHRLYPRTLPSAIRKQTKLKPSGTCATTLVTRERKINTIPVQHFFFVDAKRKDTNSDQCWGYGKKGTFKYCRCFFQHVSGNTHHKPWRRKSRNSSSINLSQVSTRQMCKDTCIMIVCQQYINTKMPKRLVDNGYVAINNDDWDRYLVIWKKLMSNFLWKCIIQKYSKCNSIFIKNILHI